MPVIALNQLSKTYSKKLKQVLWIDIFQPKFRTVSAVDGVSFEINQGESVAFLGQNGAGKTTTIKMLTGLIYPSSGGINVLGFTPFERKSEFLKQIGLVMGNKAGLNWDLTPNQSFELLQQIYEIPKHVFLNRLTELTELMDTAKFLDTQVRKLSLGERMKMELIGSILHHPKVLFLDEPTIGLDIISKKKIREFLREIQRKYGVTILLTSHDMDDVQNVCDRVIIINKGLKVYDNQLETLMSGYKQSRYVKFVFETKPAQIELGLSDCEISSQDENSATYRVNQDQMPKLIAQISAEYSLVDIEILTVPLEEVIMKVI